MNQTKLTNAAMENMRKNIIYINDSDFRSTLVAGANRYRVSSPGKKLNHSEAMNFCKSQNSKLAEVKTEYEKNVLRFLLNETVTNSKY